MRSLLLLALVSACTLYGDDGALGDDCTPLWMPYEIIDPVTLACEDFGYSSCASDPCIAPVPSWGLCASACRGLGEAACYGTSGCRTVYDWACYTGDAPCEALTPYLGCYPIDQRGPLQGECADLDAESCSAHDDCIALHDRAGFRSCEPEAR